MGTVRAWQKEFGKRQARVITGASIDYSAVCTCGHARSYHHRAMGCQHWDCRRAGSGYCECEGFRPLMHSQTRTSAL